MDIPLRELIHESDTIRTDANGLWFARITRGKTTVRSPSWGYPTFHEAALWYFEKWAEIIATDRDIKNFPRFTDNEDPGS